MKRSIFPKEVIDNSYEQIVSEYSRSTKAIYLSILIALVLVVISTLFIKVDVGVSASGIIKPQGERIVVCSPANGTLIQLNCRENDIVHKGDTLFRVWSDNTSVSLPELKRHQMDLENMLSDLNFLVLNKVPQTFQSLSYSHEYQYYCALMEDLKNMEEENHKIYIREKQLFDKGMSSLSEFEKYESEYKQSKRNVESLKRKQLTQWQSDRINYQQELNRINTSINQIEIQNKESYICAMVDGNIQQIFNVKNFSYLVAGQQVLEISPNGNLYAECYVESKDIGLIKKGLPVRLRIDAFDYTQWGVATGRVEEIANDITVVENASFYKVLCSLDEDVLSLKNGYKGTIKKGMTLNARMVVNKRTIFQMIYDKIDDWLNPTNNIE